MLKDSYISVGAIYFFPYVGLGHRWQSGHHGADLSLSIKGIPPIVYTGKIDALYHFIPKPNPNSQFYFGAEIGLNSIGQYFYSWNGKFLVTPELVFGYQYSSAGRMRFV